MSTQVQHRQEVVSIFENFPTKFGIKLSSRIRLLRGEAGIWGRRRTVGVDVGIEFYRNSRYKVIDNSRLGIVSSLSS